MKRIYCIIVLLVFFLGVFQSNVIAFVQPTDNILNDDENAIYMVGGNYLSLLSLPYNIGDFDLMYKIHLKNNSKTLIYKDNNARMDRLTLSPDYTYTAVIKGSGSFIKTNEMLIVTTKENKEVVSFKDDIRKYVWSSDGKKIAYMTGEDIEGRGLRSTGVWIYDLEKKGKIKVSDKAADIQWLPTGDIYVIDYERKAESKGRGELIYNSYVYSYKDKTAKDVGIKGIKFSLDGKYSILLTPQYGDITAQEKSIRINFYDIKSDKIIPLAHLTNILSEPERIVWDSFMWVKENRVVFEKSIMNSLVRDIIICDIESNKVLKSLNGKVVGTNSDRSKIVVFHEGKFEAVDIP